MAPPDLFTVARADLSGPADCTTLITGGTSGIGLETALLLHDISPRNRIVIVDRSSVGTCKASSSFKESDRVLFVQCDITDWRAQRAAFGAGVVRFGRIDNVFVNAGIYERGAQLLNDELDQYGELKEPDRTVLNVDLSAALDTIKLAIHHMRHGVNGKTGGNIVLTASLAGYLGTSGAPLYSAAKHGLVGLLRALKHDVAKLGIAISLVAPGITVTELAAGRNPNEPLSDFAKRMRGVGIPINDPGEVAAAVVWLMSLGTRANGKGILVQAGKSADVEAGIATNRKDWMSPVMLQLFRSGSNALLKL